MFCEHINLSQMSGNYIKRC